MTPKLSICIPTRNRATYLGELLESIKLQQHDDVEIIVSDNASGDSTRALCLAASTMIRNFRYVRNDSNIGAVPNLRQVLNAAAGDWVWPIGDDDVLERDTLWAVLTIVYGTAGGLIVFTDKRYTGEIPFGAYSSTSELVAAASRSSPHFLIERTLMASNVFRRSQLGDGHALFGTPFEHMAHADMAGERGVLVSKCRPISTRKKRPPCVDGEWPDIEIGWHQYLGWLKRWQYPELDVESVLATVPRRKLDEIKSSPLRYVWNNLGSIASWGGIKWAAKRAISYIK